MTLPREIETREATILMLQDVMAGLYENIAYWREEATKARDKLEKVADLVRKDRDFDFEMIHSVGFHEDEAFDKGVIAVQDAVRRVLEEGTD